MVSTPAPLEVSGVPPGLDVALGGETRHFVKGFVEQADIGGIDDFVRPVPSKQVYLAWG